MDHSFDFRQRAFKLSYNLKTVKGKSTAMNRAPIPVKTLQRDVQATNTKGDKYVILESGEGSLGVDQLFILTLSRRIEMKDEEKVKAALKQQLAMQDGKFH